MYKTINIKTKTIHDCAECPYRRWKPVPYSSIEYCGICLTEIKDITTILLNCPLEDYKEMKKRNNVR